MPRVRSQDLAKLARSLAVWGTSHDVLLLELLICAEAKRADLEPSHTADVLWALGRANFRSAPSTHLIQLLVLPIWTRSST